MRCSFLSPSSNRPASSAELSTPTQDLDSLLTPIQLAYSLTASLLIVDMENPANKYKIIFFLMSF